MNLSGSELDAIYQKLGKTPNVLEQGMFEVMWSEHCSYKNSRFVLKQLPGTGDYVLQGPGENAGIVSMGEGDALAFKIESHNHPSAVEPYQGALTGVGGIIRDILSMGANPVALLNSLRFSPISEGTEDWKRARYLFSGVISGIGSYGNCIGVPTVGGEIYFDPAYRENPLVNAMCVGYVKEKDIRCSWMDKPGNVVLLIGAKTGRDGILGASFASEALSGDGASERPSVQVGDPFMGKLLIEACNDLKDIRGVVGIQDLGAGGLVSAVSEMASKTGVGTEIYAHRVPTREAGMTSYEIMLSESQERMLLVINPDYEKEIKNTVYNWGLDATIIGKVIAEEELRVLYNEEIVARVPPKYLTDGPIYAREVIFPNYLQNCWDEDEHLEEMLKKEVQEKGYKLSEVLLELLGTENIASKLWIYQQFDHTVGTDTIKAPGQGAAVMRFKGTNKGYALTCDGNARCVYLDPFRGGSILVAEASRNLVVSGAQPIGLTNCLNFGNPEKSEVYYQLYQTTAGMEAACRTLNIPVTGGNVSLYNEGKLGEIKPTPVIGMVGKIDDLKRVLTPGFEKPGEKILLFGETWSEFGGSELAYIFGKGNSGRTPVIDLLKEQKLQEFLLLANKQGLLSSCQDLSEGGLGVTLAKGCLLGKVGAKVDLSNANDFFTWLFSESQSRVIASVAEQNLDAVIQLAGEWGIKLETIGVTTISKKLHVNYNGGENFELSVKEMDNHWNTGLTNQIS